MCAKGDFWPNCNKKSSMRCHKSFFQTAYPMNRTHRFLPLLLPLLALTACTQPEPTASRREKMLHFAVHHPYAAYTIGPKKDDADNITSTAVRFSTRIGLDDAANPDGRGTQVNAVRHTLWQASIAARFNADIAKAAGDAYERNNTPPQADQTEFDILYQSDESIDLRNNAIGRSIGQAHPGASIKELTRLILDRYHQEGLWQAFRVERAAGQRYQIRLTRLSDQDYQQAIEKLSARNEQGR